MNDVLINQCNIAINKMVILMKISFLFLAIAMCGEVYVGGLGPFRAGKKIICEIETRSETSASIEFAL